MKKIFTSFILSSVICFNSFAEPTKINCTGNENTFDKADMHCFVNGQPADAEMINANFKALLDRSWKKKGDDFHLDPNNNTVCGADSCLDSEDDMIVKKNGNVGIGIVNPEAKLELNGDIKLTGTLNFGLRIVKNNGQNNTVVTAICPAEYVVIAGGCNSSNGNIISSVRLDNMTWRCIFSGATNNDAQAICSKMVYEN